MNTIPLTDTNLFREIHAQPQAIANFLRQARPAIGELAAAIERQAIDHIVIAARGTSDNAGRYAKYVLGIQNGLQVALATPSTFTLYRRPVRFGRALVLGISQSGQSPDIVEVVAEARRQGALTAAVTNTPASPLAQQADVVIDLQAGEEKSVAATKTYTSSIAAVAALSAALARDDAMAAALAAMPDAMQRTLTTADAAAHVAARFRYMQHCVVIGRGYNYATAFELALKLKELTYSIVEPYSSADFLHGPFAVLNEGFPVIVLAPQGALSAELLTFIDKLRERRAELVTISDHTPTLERATLPIALPASVPEWLSPLTAIVPGQLLAMHLAHTRHYDVDAPRALKKVTETR